MSQKTTVHSYIGLHNIILCLMFHPQMLWFANNRITISKYFLNKMKTIGIIIKVSLII